MGVLSRIGVALDSDLLKRFDDFISRLGYTNRSEAFRDLIRDRLVGEQTANPNSTVVGTVTLIYDASGAVIAGADVQVQSTDGAVQKTPLSGQNGSFVISGLSSGNYRLVISKPDFEMKKVPRDTARLYTN